MNIQKGDYVTRNSYDNDVVFVVLNMHDDTAYLKGVDVRLYADSKITDLTKTTPNRESEDFTEKVSDLLHLDRESFFYLPGKIMMFDSDSSYLERCMKFYKDTGVKALGKCIKESDLPNVITKYLNEAKPDIVVITGHDAYYKKKGDSANIKNYQNSENFVKSIINARKWENSHEKLVIIAGACQSDYEELIKAGANYASSPKRVNIHALDPAIIAVTVALSERNKQIDLINLLKRTKYGSDGMGGIIGSGVMYVGYPR